MNRYNKNSNNSKNEKYNLQSNASDDFESPFDQMMQGFNFPRGFGGFGDFFGNFGALSRFDDMHSDMFANFESISGGAMPGTVIKKSYVSRVKYNPDGEPEKETYQTQSVKQVDQAGRKIQEKQEAYQNTRSGVQKAAHQRMLDSKGHKYVKEKNRRTGDEQEHNIYKGFQEDELDNFNKDYNDYRQKVNFERNYQLLKAPNNRRAIGGGSSSNTNEGYGNNNNNNRKKPKALPDNYVSRR